MKHYAQSEEGQTMSAAHWMHEWRSKFALLGTEVVVADVGQSSVFLDMAERKVILAPSLNVFKAEKILTAVYDWWRCGSEEPNVACALA